MEKAYLIVEHIITDAEKFEEYRAKVGPMITKHGGRYLTKGGSHKFPEGGHWKPERVVVIEFPDLVQSLFDHDKPSHRAVPCHQPPGRQPRTDDRRLPGLSGPGGAQH